jgi:phosphate transport system permease protein
MAGVRSGNLWDTLCACAVWGTALTIGGIFFWILGDVLIHGIPRLSWAFLFTEPMSAGRKGGIGPILVSTGLILSVCMLASLSIGMGAAIFLAEFTPVDSLFGIFVRRSLDVLSGVPSIVFGLFGNAFFCKFLGLGFSILSGGLTLACMVLPIFIRSAEEGLRAVPFYYKISGAALGITREAVLFKLILPAAMPGLVVGFLLGVGRAMAETAALIFTSGYVDRMPTSLFDSGRSLSIHIYDLSMNVAGGNASAYGSALVLISLLLIINGTSRFLAKKWFGHPSAA